MPYSGHVDSSDDYEKEKKKELDRQKLPGHKKKKITK